MRDLETIRKLFHAQFLHVRNCNNLVQSDDFEIAYKLASEEEQDEILLAIAETNREKIKTFMNNKILEEGTPFEQLSIRKLQEIGVYLNIPYYKNLSKTDLIKEIKNVAETLKANSERKHIQSQQTQQPRENSIRIGGYTLLDSKSSGTYGICKR